MLVATRTNSLTGGFPCGASGSTPVCLSKTGFNLVEFVSVGAKIDYRFAFTSANSVPEQHMFIGAGEAAYIGGGASSGIPTGPTGILRGVGMSAIDGKILNTALLTQSDGYTPTGYTMVSDPRLFILSGTTFVREVPMPSGSYSVTLPGAQYTCIAQSPGFMTVFDPDCTIVAGATVTGKMIFAPILRPGQARVVLTWAVNRPGGPAVPKDLDSYLLGPAVPACEAFWKMKRCPAGSGDVEYRLDKDDTSTGGPETITILKILPGKYVFRVNEYRGVATAPKWAVSQSAVTFYNPMGSAYHFAVGSTPGVATNGYIDGTNWYVFTMDGQTGQVQECTPALCPIRPLPKQ